MIKANYVRYGKESFDEFEDDELQVAAYFLINGMYEGKLAIKNITNDKGEELLNSEQILKEEF